jgi:hypothetical protein
MKLGMATPGSSGESCVTETPSLGGSQEAWSRGTILWR